jgi:hypothetical protein
VIPDIAEQMSEYRPDNLETERSERQGAGASMRKVERSHIVHDDQAPESVTWQRGQPDLKETTVDE